MGQDRSISRSKKSVEVCFSPVEFPAFKNTEAIVVVVDILRATSAICTAFEHGANKIIPVATLDEAQVMKSKGYMVAAERDGLVQDFADFGNSPFNFHPDRVRDREIVYSTTNGTQAIHLGQDCHKVVIGAYLNHSAMVEWLIRQNRDVVVLCAAWKTRFSLEDSLYAGALSKALIDSGRFRTICDSAKASMDLYSLAETDLLGYIDKVAQRTRLRKNKLDDVIPFCHQMDYTRKIPFLEKDYLLAMEL